MKQLNLESNSIGRDNGSQKWRSSEEQIIGFLRDAAAGLAVSEFRQRHGLSPRLVSTSDAKRLKALEAENARIKRLLAEAMLENEVTKVSLRQK